MNRDARSVVRKAGPAREVLTIGIMPDPTPAQGDVRIRIAASGINPGDVKKRQNAFGYGMPYPRVIPHSDGAGYIDLVGEGVAADWIGRRVWCYGAQSCLPFGTAAEYTVAPVQLGSALYSWPVVRVPRDCDGAGGGG